jgi:hypothetical protein
MGCGADEANKSSADRKTSAINPQDFMRPFAAPPSDSSSSTMELLHEFETSAAQGPEAIGRWEGPAVPREGWDIEKGNDDYTLD